MDAFRAGCERDFEDALAAQITFGCRRWPDAVRLVGLPHVHGVLVGLGIHGDGADPHTLDGTQDAARDGAAVGDQDLFEHRAVPRQVVPALKELRDGSSRRWNRALTRGPRS